MANKKISELSTRTPSLSDLMLVGDPSSGYSYKCTITSLATIIETDIADGYVTLSTAQTISGAKTFSNNLTLTSVSNAGVDTDKFLVLNGSNVVNFRTGSEVLSDIGGQGALTLTTTGTSGAATLVGNTLNIPQYQSVLTNPITGTGTTNYIPRFSSANAIDNSIMRQSGTSIGINTSPGYILDVFDSQSASIGVGTSTNKLVLVANDTSVSLQTTNDAFITFAPQQVAAMRITSGGIVNMGANFANNFNKLNVGGSATIGYTTTVVAPNDGLSVNGSVGIGFSGASTAQKLSVNGDVSIATIANATTDTDKFLVSDSGVIKYRTGTELLSDIGGQAALTNPITGTGVNNQAAFFTGTNTIAGSSVLVLDGSNIAIGQAAAAQKLSVNGDVSIATINNATTDTDKFLVSDGGVIKYRTGTQLLSDIGGQGSLTLTTTGSSGSSTLVGNTLNVPTYTLAGLGGISLTSLSALAPLSYNNTTGAFSIALATASTDGYLRFQDWNFFADKIGGSGTTNYIPKFTSSSAIGNSQIFDNGTSIGIGTSTPSASYRLDVVASGGSFSADNNGQVISKQALDLATAGGRFTGQSNRGSLGAIHIEQTTTGADGGYIEFRTSNSGSTTPTAKMRLDASGNLGLGVTPSAWGSNTVAIQLGGSVFGAVSASLRLLNLANAYTDGTDFRYINSGVAALQYRISGGTGAHEWYTAPSGTAGNAISFTQAMTLDASGNLYVGGTVGAFGGTQKGFSAQSGTVYAILNSESATSTSSVGTVSNHDFKFVTNNTERMRITSGGDIQTGNTTGNSQGLWIKGNATSGGALEIGAYTWGTNNYGDLVFNTSNSAGGRMRITSGGNVGIGTTSPAAKLEIEGSEYIKTGNELRFYRTDNAIYTTLYDAGSTAANGFILNNTNGEGFHFKNGSTTIMRMNSSNNVGIGTTNPGYALDIYKASGNLRIYNTSNPGTEATYSKDLGLILTSYYSASGSPFTRTADIVSNADAGAESQMRFFTATSASNPAERMRITSGGNVGIGTNSPTGTGTPVLHINGTSNSELHLTNSTTGTVAGDGFTIQQNGNDTYIWNYENSFMSLGTNNTERMRITSGGNVEIKNKLLIGVTTGATASVPNGQASLINSSSGTIFSYTGSIPNPYTQNIQIDIAYTNWGGNNVIGVVDLIVSLREWNNTCGTAFGKVFATSTGAAATFSTFNTTDITTSQCTLSAASGGNYTLRITIDPTNNTDIYSIYMNLLDGGIGVSINSITVTLV